MSGDEYRGDSAAVGGGGGPEAGKEAGRMDSRLAGVVAAVAVGGSRGMQDMGFLPAGRPSVNRHTARKRLGLVQWFPVGERSRSLTGQVSRRNTAHRVRVMGVTSRTQGDSGSRG